MSMMFFFSSPAPNFCSGFGLSAPKSGFKFKVLAFEEGGGELNFLGRKGEISLAWVLAFWMDQR